MPDALPIEDVLPQLRRTLRVHDCAVLEAPPGAGKTTRVPLALIDEDWCADGAIVMLEPRRLAARMAANYMSELLGQTVGATVGYRVRMERKVSAKTRVEVVTEGLLLRRLQDDPELAGVKLLIFDEFHERNLDADLALALALDIREGLRPDLKILVMSATLDGVSVAGLMGDAPVIRSEGRAFPVETRYLAKTAGGRFEHDMTALLKQALGETTDSILAFLPGEGEINRVAGAVAAAAGKAGAEVLPLYGALPRKQQDHAVQAAKPGRRKLVLATTIAETSITIEGIGVVVDGGLKRQPRFEPRRGFGRLATVKVSKAAAEQRRGRAGRLAPGICYRLWTEAEQRGLDAFDAAEMKVADLTDFALALTEWGIDDAAALRWLDPPPPGALSQARALLQRLDALDGDGRITDIGRAIARLPLPARLGRMVVAGQQQGQTSLAVNLAALLSERDFLARGEGTDVARRLEVLRGGPAKSVRKDALAGVRRAARELARRLDKSANLGDAGAGAAGQLLALAYPDRVAARGGEGRYRLAGGGSALLEPHDGLNAADFLVAAEIGGDVATGGRIRLAAAVTREELEDLFSSQIEKEDVIEWDHRRRAVTASRQNRLGALILRDNRLSEPDPERVIAAMVVGIRRLGIEALPWTRDLRGLQSRIMFLRDSGLTGEFPDLSDQSLLAELEIWLAPYLHGIDREAKLAAIDLNAALSGRLDWPTRRRLDDLAPSHFTSPTGTKTAIDYSAEGGPLVAIRLQEMFGVKDTPRLAGDTVPLRFQLLSPAQRPLALTADLAAFWGDGYQLVRKDMRGRYPKHDWPEDPASAQPSRGAKRRRS